MPNPKGLDGHSLVPLLDDPNARWDHPAYSVFGRSNKLIGVAVRTERYRYVEYEGPKGGAMLFDHASDPHELRNLANAPDMVKARKELSALVKQHRQTR